MLSQLIYTTEIKQLNGINHVIFNPKGEIGLTVRTKWDNRNSNKKPNRITM